MNDMTFARAFKSWPTSMFLYDDYRCFCNTTWLIYLILQNSYAY